MSDMTTTTIKTNHVPRLVIDAYELTSKERETFDYLDWSSLGGSANDEVYTPSKSAEDATFFRYRGELYDIGEFIRSTDPDLSHWDGIQTDTFFSATLIKFVDDECDRLIVGRIYS